MENKLELTGNTESFRFKTNEEKPKEFVLTYNGKDLALNTKGAFITLVDVEIAKMKVGNIMEERKNGSEQVAQN